MQPDNGDRVPTLLLTKKIQDFPGPPWKIVQDLFGARGCLNIKKKMAFTYNIQSVVHCRKFSMKQNVLHCCCSFSIWTTRKKCMTFKDIFPGLSRTLSFNFQDQSHFPGLSRSWNFQEKKSRTFQEAWEPCEEDLIFQSGAHKAPGCRCWSPVTGLLHKMQLDTASEHHVQFSMSILSSR